MLIFTCKRGCQPGIYRALKQQGFVDSSTETEGAALEGLIAEHLRYWIDFQKEKSELFFWRTQAGLEVDFVVYGEKAFYAFEVKNNKVISSSDLRGLKEFKKDYPEASLAFIYRGKEKLQKDGIPCIPAEDFLKNLDPSNALLF